MTMTAPLRTPTSSRSLPSYSAPISSASSLELGVDLLLGDEDLLEVGSHVGSVHCDS